MSIKAKRNFMRIYTGIEMLSSIILTILWIIYEIRHMYYGQALTYWICACMLTLMTIGLMIPELVKQKTKRLKKSVRIGINNTIRHIPMAIMLSFAWSVQLSSDFGTILATVSMSRVIKGMLFGIIAGPIILEIVMLLVTEIAQEDVANTRMETISCKVAQ